MKEIERIKQLLKMGVNPERLKHFGKRLVEKAQKEIKQEKKKK